MRVTLAMFVVLLACGCHVRFEESVHVPATADLATWSQTAEAKRGVIVLGSGISREVAVNVSRQMITLHDDPDIERIVLVINSNGGETGALRSIYNAMRYTDKPVDTVNAGNCYSAACAIFAAATGKRYAFANAHFMVHKPRALGGKDRNNDLLDFEVDAYESILKDKGLPRDWFPLSGRDQYFTAQEAQDYGFLDAIITRLP